MRSEPGRLDTRYTFRSGGAAGVLTRGNQIPTAHLVKRRGQDIADKNHADSYEKNP